MRTIEVSNTTTAGTAGMTVQGRYAFVERLGVWQLRAWRIGFPSPSLPGERYEGAWNHTRRTTALGFLPAVASVDWLNRHMVTN